MQWLPSLLALACFAVIAPALAIAAKVKPVLDEPALGTRANVVANAITYDPRTSIAVATGKVEITYGPYVLLATRVTYNQNTDTFTANGSVTFKEPSGNTLEADEAELRDKFKEGFARHLRMLLTNDVTITADYARRTKGYLTIFDNVVYTACKHCVTSDGTPVWDLRSKTATHDSRSKTIYHTDTTLEFAGIPVLWLPYLSHPDPSVKRRSGFLIPNIRYNSRMGAGLEIPYFWNLAPNYDLTLTPMITTNQGPLLKTEWRHRLNSGIYSIDAAGIYQLDPHDIEAPGDQHWRGAARTRGEFDLGDRWTLGFDGTLTSDRTFLDDYDIDNRDEAVSEVHLTQVNDRNYFSAQALHYRTLTEGLDQSVLPYALPYVEHSYTFDSPVFGGEFGIDSSIYNLNRDEPTSPFTGVDLGTQQTRATADLHWQRQFTNDWGQVITPFARLRTDLHITENQPDPLAPGFERETETTTRLLPALGVDVRWPFLNASGSGQHILTPVAQLITASDETGVDKIGNEDAITLNFDHTSLFLQDRFTGSDRFEGGTRANAGLLYTYLAPNGGFLRASIGESFHLGGRNSFAEGSGLEDARSDLVAAVALQPYDFLRLTSQARFDEGLSHISTFEAGASLTFDRISGSVDYVDLDAEPAYGRPDAERQVVGDVTYNFMDGWNLFGGARYDFRADNFVTKTLGVGFKCDCMDFKLAYTEDEDDEFGGTDRSVKVSLSLRTLGSASAGFGF